MAPFLIAAIALVGALDGALARTTSSQKTSPRNTTMVSQGVDSGSPSSGLTYANDNFFQFDAGDFVFEFSNYGPGDTSQATFTETVIDCQFHILEQLADRNANARNRIAGDAFQCQSQSGHTQITMYGMQNGLGWPFTYLNVGEIFTVINQAVIEFEQIVPFFTFAVLRRGMHNNLIQVAQGRLDRTGAVAQIANAGPANSAAGSNM